MSSDSKAKAVYSETDKRINWLFRADDRTVKARLAELRHGIGDIPGENPSLWGMIFENLPETMLGKYGKPSKEEWAIYDALTLLALHQQGQGNKHMNKAGVSLGTAAGQLVYAYGGTDGDREKVSNRFNRVVLATDIEEVTYYLRTFIPLLRGADIGLDYSLLARDIYLIQTEAGKASVRLNWGQDYYSLKNEEEESK